LARGDIQCLHSMPRRPNKPPSPRLAKASP
jgi:hypothetical protein